LAAHGVDGNQRAFELFGLGEVIKQVRDGGDLVGLFGNRELRQRQSRAGGVGRQRVQGFQPLALVMGATRRLAVDGDEVVTLRPQRSRPTFKTPRKQRRIDTVEESANPTRAGNAEVKRTEAPQKIQMMLAPQDDVVEIVAGGDGRAGHQEQNLMQGIHDPLRLPLVRKLGKTLDEKRQTRRASSSSCEPESKISTMALRDSKHSPNHTSPSIQNPTENPVNLTSEPWRCRDRALAARHRPV